MDKIQIKLVVNGKQVSLEVNPYATLLEVLRNDLGLTGAKEGCGIGECGACTIIADGEALNSCLVLAASMEGRQITTIEGLMVQEKLDPLQEAFIKHHAIQCGFCTPGLILSAKALLAADPHPGREKIKEAISGNLCRCTGYKQVIEAIEAVALDK